MNAISIPLYIFFKRKCAPGKAIKKFARSRRFYFSRMQENSGNLLALDKVKRKLLYFKTKTLVPKCLMVDLKRMASCTVIKKYCETESGKLKTLLLSFRFFNSPRSVTVPFYENPNDEPTEIERAESSAQLWKAEISKMASLN